MEVRFPEFGGEFLDTQEASGRARIRARLVVSEATPGDEISQNNPVCDWAMPLQVYEHRVFVEVILLGRAAACLDTIARRVGTISWRRGKW